MLISLLFQNPGVFFGWILALVVSISFHEFSHAFTANALGDKTPKYEGRLTLNPLAHLDPLGTILLILIGFGWGKPVPFNPYNLKFHRFGPALVSLAGPISNFILIVFFIVVLKVLALFGFAGDAVIQLFSIIILLNMVLMLFNLIPLAPLDGSKIFYSFLPRSLSWVAERMEQYGPYILLALILLDNFTGIGIFSHVYNFGLSVIGRFL
jgi:Zn-dependent protease